MGHDGRGVSGEGVNSSGTTRGKPTGASSSTGSASSFPQYATPHRKTRWKNGKGLAECFQSAGKATSAYVRDGALPCPLQLRFYHPHPGRQGESRNFTGETIAQKPMKRTGHFRLPLRVAGTGASDRFAATAPASNHPRPRKARPTRQIKFPGLPVVQCDQWSSSGKTVSGGEKRPSGRRARGGGSGRLRPGCRPRSRRRCRCG